MRDIAGVIAVVGDQLDRPYIEQWAEHFDVLDIWRDILMRLEQA